MTNHNFDRSLRRFLRVFALCAVVLSLGCGGCDDLLDPLNYIDADQFRPDLGSDMGPSADAGSDLGTPTDSGRPPKDGGGQMFDFGQEEDAGPTVFALLDVIPRSGPVRGGNTIRIVGTGLTDDTAVFVGSTRMDVDVVGEDLVGIAPPGAGPGPVTVKAISADSEARALVDAYTYVRGLVVDSIVPSTIPTQGGTEVEIRGAGFSPPVAVSFSGDSAVRVDVVSEGLMRVVAPARPKGFADVRVTTRTESVEVEDGVLYVEPVEITDVTPASGPEAGGDTVTLSGTGFTSTMTVRIGGATAQVIGVDSVTGRAQVRTPAGVGTVDVFVETSNGSAVLEDGYTYRPDNTPFLAAVRPAFGPEAGGNEVVVTGYGFDVASRTLQFGTVTATMVQRSPTSATVRVPAGTGLVDVVLLDGATELDRLANAYTYRRGLRVDSVTPDAGPDLGGESVTIRGSGFTNAEQVHFGFLQAEFTVVDDTTIEAVTPAQRAGLVDVSVARQGMEGRLQEAYTYTTDIEIWGFTPIRGAVAGGTYVEVRGKGFFGEIGVTLDGADGTSVRRLDRNNVTFETPPHAPGEADLEVTSDAGTAAGPYPYSYFNPAARFGGPSGGPVRGAVNVSVFENGGAPIENAFVMLSTRVETPHQGFTDINGQLTLSGPDVIGPQTTTATAAGFSTTTIQTMDAENITIFLNRLEPPMGGGAGQPPAIASIHGRVTATGKLSDPNDEAKFDVAIVRTTQTTIFGGNPAPGDGSIVVGMGGRYDITTRVGDMAVVAICGSYDSATEQFEPLLMGVERYVFMSDQERKQIPIECDIPLETTATFKLVNTSYAPTGPNSNNVSIFWDFGFEGIFPSPVIGTGFSSLVNVRRQPRTEGKLADLSFVATGGSYTGRGAPFTQSRLLDIASIDNVVALPVLLEVAEPRNPLPGGRIDGVFDFFAEGPYYPDYWWVTIRNEIGLPVWQMLLPGNETTLYIPDFPDFSSLPVDLRPEPFQSGSLFVSVIGARGSEGLRYETWSYREIDVSRWEAYSVSSWAVRLR